MSTITGASLFGSQTLTGEGAAYTATAPARNESLPESFFNISPAQAEQVVQLAGAAFGPYSQLHPHRRAEFLEAIADEIEALGDALPERAHAESGLPMARLTGERGRTCGQLRMFAKLVREGSWVDARINPALPDRQPLPRPDLRRMLVPLGPVVVFGASNFPLAFSVAGGDTASALAAGCPVIVKAHPAHPGTSELVGRAIQAAAHKTQMPDGTFALVHADNAVAQALVAHPVVKAVGFTGSRAGGLALLRVAQARPEPIPVYAEMSSVNPTVILAGAMQERGTAIAEGLAGSITLGVGQFCTNPGLVFVTQTEKLNDFLGTLGAKIRATVPATMLNAGICDHYRTGLDALSSSAEVEVLAQSETDARSEATEGRPAVLTTTGSAFRSNPALSHEVFGPSSLVVVCQDEAEVAACLQTMEGQLTATLFATDTDLQTSAYNWVALLQQKAGRVLFGGYPTGVEVCEAMTHGGPFPATSDARTTSVGTAAIERFARPVTYQSFPNALLPLALQQENPLGIWREIDGVRGKE
ncbi:aldehyde dehydrogenase (NADP(+)) [Rudanella lutea]|uniref:aldehyde dehydrogenase (NADP(+)) n=1 Tax=Rudanella lutea TaxID=451374 RepID=UPI000483EFC5|nr:aldehyde dehydrogenase (NADP(+)) [Rudanella lutea]